MGSSFGALGCCAIGFSGVALCLAPFQWNLA
jgi:hypothetical protein